MNVPICHVRDHTTSALAVNRKLIILYVYVYSDKISLHTTLRFFTG